MSKNLEIIRFIDSDYNTLFLVKNHEKIKIIQLDGNEVIGIVEVIDEYHFKLIHENGFKKVYHICEFAERMESLKSTYQKV